MDDRGVVSGLTCNICQYHLDGSMFRTLNCFHVFCSECAAKTFAMAASCPVCHARISEGEVNETIVGVGGLPIEEALYNYAFKENSWASIVDNLCRVQHQTLLLSSELTYIIA